MHVHRSSPGFSFNSGCTYPLFRMHVHLPMSISARWLGCTYPLFRMHVHPQINIILYNRHLLISELSYFCFITSETSLLLAFFRFCLRCSTDLTSGVHLPRELLLIPKFLILIAAFTSLSNFARHEGHTHER